MLQSKVQEENMDYKATAAEILSKVGGREKVANVGHCSTRLRFTLKDSSIPDKEEIKKITGVLGVVYKGGQFQVIIGPDVAHVYSAMIELIGAEQRTEEKPAEVKKQKVLTKALNMIAGSMFPIIPALAGGGMINALLAIMAAANLVSKSSTTYQMLSFMGNAPFYFLPVILGVSAAKKFSVNPYIGASIGAMLISPNFVNMVAAAKEAGTAITLFGIPVTLVSYSSSVIPIMLAVWMLSYVEPFLNKYVAKEIRTIFVPLLEFLIVGCVTFWALGPIGTWLGELLGALIGWLDNAASWLVPTIVGAFTPLLVMTGMHYGLIPLGVNQLATSGIDTIAGPGMLVSNIAQGGANLAASVKFKNKEKKALAMSVGVEAICGITEPALYGISLPYKTPLYSAMIGGGIGGFFLGIFKVGRYAQVPPSIFALPSYIPESGSLHVMLMALICSVIAFVIAFIAEMILGVKEEG